MNLEMAQFSYNYFSQQFGFKKIADQKFMIFIMSLKNYLPIIRVNIFSRFLGLMEKNINYSNEELRKYLEVLDFCTNQCTHGVTITDNLSEIKYYIVSI